MQIMDLRNLEKKLNSFGVVTKRAKAEYETTTRLQLTQTPTKVTSGWAGTLEEITFSSGDFIVEDKGEYTWSIERQYENTDQNSNGVYLNLEIRQNNIVVYSRTAPIMDAQNPNTPGYETFSTEFITPAEKDDAFSVWVYAEDGASSPTSTYLDLLRIVSQKTKQL